MPTYEETRSGLIASPPGGGWSDAEARLAFLAGISTHLADLTDVGAMQRAIAELVVPRYADWSVVDLLGDGEHRRCVAVDRPELRGAADRLERLPPPPEAWIHEVIRRGRPVVLRADAPGEARPSSEEAAALIRVLGGDSCVVAPMIARGRPIGVLSCIYAGSGRRYTERDGEFLFEVAARAGLSVDNLTLLAREVAARHAAEEARRIATEARQAAEAAEARGGLLADVSAALAGALDTRAALQRLVELVVPRFADGCAVDLELPDQPETLVAVEAMDPRKRELARQLRRWPVGPDGRRHAYDVMRSGEPEVYPEFVETSFEYVADPLHRSLLRALDVRSVMIVPIRARGGPIGAITLAMSESGRRYAGADVPTAVQIAERAAVAIANARLFEAEQRARAQALKLQRVTAAFGSARTVHEIAERAVNLARELTGATIGTVSLVSENRTELELTFGDGLDADAQARALTIPLDRPSLSRIALETGERAVIDEPGRAIVPVDLGRRQAWPGTRAAFPLRLRGEVTGVFGLAFDDWRRLGEDDRQFLQAVADQCAQALDRARAYDGAVRAIAVRDEFLSIAGHELKTPLTALLLQVQTLVAGVAALPPSYAERIAKLERTTARLARLIDQLLDVSRITAGRFELDREEVELGALIGEVIGRIAEPLARSGSRIHVELDGELRGRWDRSRIEQVVTNLLTNAVKYGRGAPIEVQAGRHGDRARLVVRDHGIGISADDQARIFERFERAVSSRHFGGLGLGLWIVRQIVEAHGGTIEVTSAPGQGAEFRVELPL